MASGQGREKLGLHFVPAFFQESHQLSCNHMLHIQLGLTISTTFLLPLIRPLVRGLDT
jgi:hypothetical protein